MKKLLFLCFTAALCCAFMLTSCNKRTDVAAGKWKFTVNNDLQGNCDFRDGKIADIDKDRNLGNYTVVDERNVKINLVGVRNPTDNVTVNAVVSNDTMSANFEGNQMKWEKIK